MSLRRLKNRNVPTSTYNVAMIAMSFHVTQPSASPLRVALTCSAPWGAFDSSNNVAAVASAKEIPMKASCSTECSRSHRKLKRAAPSSVKPKDQ